MTSKTLKQRNGKAVGQAVIDAFTAGFHGQVIQPNDIDYETARQIWNASIDKHPGLIARCSGTTDIVQAVMFARANDLLVAVRGGGHNVAGRALCDDGIVIDLSAMKGVFVDQRLQTVRVQAGATLGDIDRETHLYGLAVPTGVVSKTGIAGLTLGGGVGWLVRKYGLTCDNLLSCEVVTAEGKLVTADAVTNADLFWALRGGGGNFGIVASFLFRAHRVATILGGPIIYPRADAVAVLRNYRTFIASAPEELTAYAAMISAPDGQPAVAVAACYCGDLAKGESILKPLRAFGTPLLDGIQRLPFPAMQTLFDASFPDRSHNYWKSTFLKGLSDDVIDLVVEHANRMESPLGGVVIEFYGGAAGRVGHRDTAFAQRQSQYNLGIMAQWLDASESDKHIRWTRDAWDALKAHSSGGYLLNFLHDEPAETIKAAFGDNYGRLSALKVKYDPTNFFSLNQNVTPEP